MTEIKFGQCVLSVIGKGEYKRVFVLPYTGSLSQLRVQRMAYRLHAYMRSIGAKKSSMQDAETWLRATSLAKREKDVTLVYRDGVIDLINPTWEMCDLPTDQVVILKDDYKPTTRKEKKG